MVALARLVDPRLFQGAGIVALVAGVWTWSQWLGTTPALAVAAASPSSSVPSAASQWFDERPIPLDIKVSGLLVGARGGVAILAINDKPPRAYKVGETLAPHVRLLGVEATGMTIDQSGQTRHLSISRVLESQPVPVLLAAPR